MSGYFKGWYYKCQSDTQSIAVIPAIHKCRGERSCSVQLITPDGSWSIPYPGSAFRREKGAVYFGDNKFSPQGIRLKLETEGLSAVGSLRFGPFTPLRYDIMGPFRYVPFLECRHSVYSLAHSVTGKIRVNDTVYTFRDDTGYMEADQGRSFPRQYAWTQCSFPAGSLMLSVAEIPLGGFHFTGVIGVVLYQGKQYRLGTYWGAKAAHIGGGEIIIRQGSYRLTARLLEQTAQPLSAPVQGQMARTIHENIVCRAAFTFQKGDQVLFSLDVPNASFEYEYPT